MSINLITETWKLITFAALCAPQLQNELARNTLVATNCPRVEQLRQQIFQVCEISPNLVSLDSYCWISRSLCLRKLFCCSSQSDAFVFIWNAKFRLVLCWIIQEANGFRCQRAYFLCEWECCEKKWLFCEVLEDCAWMKRVLFCDKACKVNKSEIKENLLYSLYYSQRHFLTCFLAVSYLFFNRCRHSLVRFNSTSNFCLICFLSFPFSISL